MNRLYLLALVCILGSCESIQQTFNEPLHSNVEFYSKPGEDDREYDKDDIDDFLSLTLNTEIKQYRFIMRNLKKNHRWV